MLLFRNYYHWYHNPSTVLRQPICLSWQLRQTFCQPRQPFCLLRQTFCPPRQPFCHPVTTCLPTTTMPLPALSCPSPLSKRDVRSHLWMWDFVKEEMGRLAHSGNRTCTYFLKFNLISSHSCFIEHSCWCAVVSGTIRTAFDWPAGFRSKRSTEDVMNGVPICKNC